MADPKNNFPFQADPYTAALPPPDYQDPYGRALTRMGQGMLQHAMIPGAVFQGVQPQQPGMISDVDVARQLMLEQQAQQFGPSQALSMAGGGTSFAQRGLGAAGGTPGLTGQYDVKKYLTEVPHFKESMPAAPPSGQLAKELNALLKQIPADESHFLPKPAPPKSPLPPGLDSLTTQQQQQFRQLRAEAEAKYWSAKPAVPVTPSQSQPAISGPPAVTGPRLFQTAHTDFQSHLLYNDHILPHYGGNEQAFVDHYFAGYHSPNMELASDGSALELAGNLVNPSGQRIGSISRHINPEEGTAYHGFLRLGSGIQGGGITKNILRNQVDLYQRMGLESVKLNADIDVGSYAWAKYGFLPTDIAEWTDVAENALRRLSMESYKLSPRDYETVRAILQSEDPKSIWDLADLKMQFTDGVPVAKSLLMNNSWNGKLNLHNPDVMQRFKTYVR